MPKATKTFLTLLFLCFHISISKAWLPDHDREIYSLEGTNLFNQSASSFISQSTHSKRYLPTTSKIRGVNLGSLFIFEPWLANNTWASMGCGGLNSESDCVSALGQAQANIVFQQHWSSWITQADLAQMQSYGLNTIRVPVGYWMKEDLVYANSEYFPQGGLGYLERLCGWAADLGLYVIIDLHGAPGAQEAHQPFTGQYAPTAGFYVSWQYARAESFLSWITYMIHTNSAYRTVGMVEVVNEPSRNASVAVGMLSDYYPAAYNAIRNAESALGVTASNALHVQFMNSLWGSGDPLQYITNPTSVAFDDHRFVQYDTTVAVTKSAYLQDACSNNRSTPGESPTIVGEFSLSVPYDVQWTAAWDPSTSANQVFYAEWWAALRSGFEGDTFGWIFWTWKSELGTYRWAYQDAVSAGVIPSNMSVPGLGAC